MFGAREDPQARAYRPRRGRKRAPQFTALAEKK